MERVKRIYVHNFGYKTAWYDNFLFDLTHRDDNRPSNAIFNVENGGGKTSLLAFIFSCFDPRQDRWLQHLQKKNHKFTDYFSKDGLPAYLAIEWERAGRTLVLGQAVSLHEGGREVDRWFFCYEGAIEDLPLPVPGTLVDAQSLRMGEFKKWLHRGKEHHSDFFSTDLQDAWLSHLSGERNIDVDLLRMQVDFNSLEGGRDEGFLTFNTEQEFLHKFLSLVLDSARAEAVRSVVEQATKHMASKPRYEASLEQLGLLSEKFNAFVKQADHLELSRQQYAAVKQRVAGVAKAALERSRQEEALSADLNQEALQKEEQAKASAAAGEQHRREALMLQRALHERKAETCKRARDVAHDAHENTQKRLRLLQAARIHWRIRANDEQVEQIQSEINAAQEELLPFLERAQKNGSMLSCAIGRRIDDIETRRLDAAGKEKAAKDRIYEIEQETKATNGELNTASKDEARVSAFIQESGRQKKRLIDDGVLAANDATSDAAIEREQEKKRAAEEKAKECLAKAKELEAQAQRLDAEAVEKNSAALQMQVALTQTREKLRAGRALEQALVSNTIFREAADASEVDLDSPALPQMLQRSIEGANNEMASLRSRLKAAENRLERFEETGLDYWDADVDVVVKHLRQVGIKAAKPSNIYLADSVEEADRARSLVHSDPARFLGVTITSESDWKRVQQVAGTLHCELSRPVTLTPSSSSLFQAQLGEDRVVVMPDEDTAYNRAAAESVQTKLQQEIERCQKELSALDAWQVQAAKARSELDRWRRDYGGACLRAWEEDSRRMGQEMQDAQTRAAQCLQDAQKNRSAAATLRAEEKEQRDTVHKCDNRLQRLIPYRSDYERPLPSKIKEQQLLLQKCEQLKALLGDLAKEKEERDGDRNAAHDQVQECARQKRDLDDERGKIRHRRDAGFDVEQSLAQSSYNLEHLRDTYDVAVKDYERKAAGISPDLGERKNGLLQQQRQLESDLHEFRNIERAALESVERNTDFEAEISAQKKAVEESEVAKSKAADEFSASEALRSSFIKEHPDVPVPSEVALAMPDEEIQTRIQQASESLRQCQLEEAEARKNAADKRQAATVHKNTATPFKTWHKSLCSFFTDGILPHAELVEIDGDVDELCQGLCKEVEELRQANDKAVAGASRAFSAVSQMVVGENFKSAVPDLSSNIAGLDFNDACARRKLLAETIGSYIEATRHELEQLAPEFQKCAKEVYDLAQQGISMLSHACAQKMPLGASYVAGKPVLKMGVALGRVPAEMRSEHVNRYLDDVFAGIESPKTGAAIVAQCLRRFGGRDTLGLQVLKMEPNEDDQYQPIDNFKGSGGQSAVFAMFLYLILSGLRAEVRGAVAGSGGGPLFLDNPFAKVQTYAMVEAQRLLAEAIGVQLIAFAAHKEHDILEGFGRLIRLRRGGSNSETGRCHIEKASVAINQEASQG